MPLSRKALFSRFLSSLLIVAISLESGPVFALRNPEPTETDVQTGLEERLRGQTPPKQKGSDPFSTFRVSFWDRRESAPQPLPSVRPESFVAAVRPEPFGSPQGRLVEGRTLNTGLEEGEEASPLKVPARLVRYFGRRQAAIIYDEVRKTVTRLMPDASEAERERGIEEIGKKTGPLTFSYMAFFSRGVHTFALILSVLFLPISKLAAWVFQLLFGEGIITSMILKLDILWAVPLSVISFPLLVALHALVACDGGRGAYDKISSSIFLKKGLGESFMRSVVSHEIAHRYFSSTTWVMNAVSRLRQMEERSLVPDPELALLVEQVPLEDLEAHLRKRAGPTAKLLEEKGGVLGIIRWIGAQEIGGSASEPLWSYRYGKYLGDVIYLLSGRNFPKAYRIVTLMGQGDSLAEALGKVSEQQPGAPSAEKDPSSGLEEVKEGYRTDGFELGEQETTLSEPADDARRGIGQLLKVEVQSRIPAGQLEGPTTSYVPPFSGANRQASAIHPRIAATNPALNSGDNFPKKSPATPPANRILEKSAGVLANMERRPSVSIGFSTAASVPQSSEPNNTASTPSDRLRAGLEEEKEEGFQLDLARLEALEKQILAEIDQATYWQVPTQEEAIARYKAFVLSEAERYGLTVREGRSVWEFNRDLVKRIAQNRRQLRAEEMDKRNLQKQKAPFHPVELHNLMDLETLQGMIRGLKREPPSPVRLNRIVQGLMDEVRSLSKPVSMDESDLIAEAAELRREIFHQELANYRMQLFFQYEWPKVRRKIDSHGNVKVLYIPRQKFHPTFYHTFFLPSFSVALGMQLLFSPFLPRDTFIILAALSCLGAAWLWHNLPTTRELTNPVHNDEGFHLTYIYQIILLERIRRTLIRGDEPPEEADGAGLEEVDVALAEGRLEIASSSANVLWRTPRNDEGVNTMDGADSTIAQMDRLKAQIRVRKALERIAPFLSDRVVGIGPTQARLHADLFEMIGEALSDSDPDVRQRFLDRLFIVTGDANQAVRLQGQGWLASNHPDHVVSELIDRFSKEPETEVIDHYATERESGVLRGRINTLWPELKEWVSIERQEMEADPGAFLRKILSNLVSVLLDWIPCLDIDQLISDRSFLVKA